MTGLSIEQQKCGDCRFFVKGGSSPDELPWSGSCRNPRFPITPWGYGGWSPKGMLKDYSNRHSALIATFEDILANNQTCFEPIDQI